MTLTFNSSKNSELLSQYQPKLIRTEAGSERALAIAEELMHRPNRSPEENENHDLSATLSSEAVVVETLAGDRELSIAQIKTLSVLSTIHALPETMPKLFSESTIACIPKATWINPNTEPTICNSGISPESLMMLSLKNMTKEFSTMMVTRFLKTDSSIPGNSGANIIKSKIAATPAGVTITGVATVIATWVGVGLILGGSSCS
jgi:hypothetical protein